MQFSSEFQNRWNKIASDGSEPKERPIARLRCAPLLGSDAPPILNYPAPPRLVRPVPVSKKKRTTTKRVREKRIESLERERRRQRELLSRSGSWTGSITWTSKSQSLNVGPAIAQVLLISDFEPADVSYFLYRKTCPVNILQMVRICIT